MPEKHLRQNPEWQALSGRENRMSNQFGEIGDNGDGTKESFNHTNGNGEALIIPGVNCGDEEAQQLSRRGAIFPLEIAEPGKATFVYEADFFPRPVKRNDI